MRAPAGAASRMVELATAADIRGWVRARRREGHRIADEIEDRIRAELPGSAVLTHLEPIEDPASYRDEELFR